MARGMSRLMRGWSVLLVLSLLIATGGAASAAWVHTMPVSVSEKLITAMPASIVIPFGGMPDEEDDPQPLQPPLTPSTWPCVFHFLGRESVGPGLHVAIVSGNVFTQVPVLEVLGPRGDTLEVTLYYDSLRSHEDRGCGYGWSHSLLHTWYLVPGEQGEADKIVIVDGTGRRRAHAEIDGEYSRPPAAAASVTDVQQHNLTVQADSGEIYQFSNYQLSSITTPQGLVTTFAYDLNERLQSVTDGYGRQVQFTYYANGQLETITDPANNTTTLTYDASNSGLLVGIEDPEQAETTFQYEVVTRGSDTLHRMTRETLKNGNYFTCVYDDTAGAMSRTIQDSSDPAQTIVSVASAEFVMVRGQEIDDTTAVTVTDERGEVWEYERDSWWHLTKMIPPLDEPLSEGLEPPFAISVYGDDASNAPGAFAQLVSATNTLGQQRSFTYDENGMVESVTDRRNQTTTYAYEHVWDHDNDGGTSTPAIPMPAYLTEKVLPDTTVQPTWNYVYDAYRCDLTEIWDPIREDGQDLIATIDYTYYDETNPSLAGRLERVVQTDRNSYTTTYEYGTDGKLLTKTQQTGGQAPNYTTIVTTYVHDALGRMTRETIDMGAADDVVTECEYDKMGRITAVVSDPGAGNLALRTEFAYDDHGLLLTTTDPKGTVTKYTYDNRNRLLTVTEDFGEGRLNLLTQYTYAADGTVTATDPRGNSTQQEYDPRGHLARVLDAEGYETLFERDLEGKLVEVDRGRAPGTGGERDIRSFEYDSLGRIRCSLVGVENTEAGKSAIKRWYTYPTTTCGCGGAGGHVPSLEEIGPTDCQVEQISREFDLMGRVEYVTRHNNEDAVTQYEYDPEGQVTKVWGPEGEQVEFTYDGVGRLLTRRVLASVDGDPAVETWLETFYSYDAAGNLKVVGLPNGHMLFAAYDAVNRLLNVKEVDNQTLKTLIAYTYDANGNVLTRSDSLNTWTYTYDALNRLVSETDPSSETSSYVYDEASNLVYMEDRKGIYTRAVYDALNRMTEKAEDTLSLAMQPLAVGDPTTPTYNTKTYYEYDGSRLVEIRDHDENATTYDYNDWGLLEKITYPDAGDVDFTYDNWGYPHQRTDQRGITTTYTHDVQGQLRQRVYNNDGRIELFEYDGSGRIEAAYLQKNSDHHKMAAAYTYDLAGRLTSEAFDASSLRQGDLYNTSVGYSSNSTTHIADWTMTTPAGRQVVHQVDRLGRLISAHDANDSTIGVDWSFDDANRRTGVDYRFSPFDFSTSYGYDANNRTTSIEYGYSIMGVDQLLWGEHYSYDAEGNRTYTERLHTPNRSEVYTHDNRHRLVYMDRGTLAADKQSIQTGLVDDRLATYQYWYNLDRRGNWLNYRESVNGVSSKQTRTANAVNEYTEFDIDGPSLPELPVPLTYDAAGNLTSDDTAPNWDDTSGPSGQEYFYDGENRLIAVTRNLGAQTLIEYEYDALGRRIHTIEHFDTDGTVLTTPRVTRHVYFGMEVIEEYIIDNFETPSEADTLAREFIWGDTARFFEPVVMIDHTDAGDLAAGTAEDFHYLHDVLGSVVGLINSSGFIVERYTYDPYGKTFIESWTGSGLTYAAADTSQYGNPFRWTGQRYDETVQLYGFLYRHYSPRHGRWLQRDPLGHAAGDVNFYQYAMGQALKLVDPLGLCVIPLASTTWDELQEEMVASTRWESSGSGQGMSGATTAAETRYQNCLQSGRTPSDCSAQRDRDMENARNGEFTKTVVGGFDEIMSAGGRVPILDPGRAQTLVLLCCDVYLTFAPTGYGAISLIGKAYRVLNKADKIRDIVSRGIQIMANPKAAIASIVGLRLAGRLTKKVRQILARRRGADKWSRAPKNGTQVTRNWGGQSGPHGQSWTTDPVVVQSRNSLGLETTNTGQFVSHGTVIDSTGITTRQALPWGRFAGGGQETLIPSARTQIRLDAVTMPDSPLPWSLPVDPRPLPPVGR